MRIQFTDYFNKEIKDKFNITIRTSKNTIENPLDKQEFNYNGIVLGFYIKELDKSELLLIIAEKKEDLLLVIFGFKIKSDLITAVTLRKPISLFQKFIDKYGLAVKIGGNINKLFLMEEIKFVPSMNTKLFEIINPENHSFVTSSYFRIRKDNVVECALVFAIDTYKYSADLL